MRLSTKFLTLVSISVAMTCHIKYPEECKQEMIEYEDCLKTDSTAYTTEKCKNYFKNSFDLLPKCKSVLTKEEITCGTSNLLANYGDLILTVEGKDESGNECGIVTAMNEHYDEKSEHESKMLAAAKESCGSKKCVDAAINGFTQLYEAHKIDWEIETDEFYEELLSTLRSCGSNSGIDRVKKPVTTTTTVKKITTVAVSKKPATTKKIATTKKVNKTKKVTTTAIKSKATNISTNGRCGKGFGKCPGNKCCSKRGYCGVGIKFCSIERGCQSEFGKCAFVAKGKATSTIISKKTTKAPVAKKTTKAPVVNKKTTKAPVVNKKTTKAPVVNKKTTKALIANKKTTKAPAVSKKTTKAPVANKKTTKVAGKSNVKVSTNGRCGKGFGKCPANQCCSKHGYCGTAAAYCGVGCQSAFGKCN